MGKETFLLYTLTAYIVSLRCFIQYLMIGDEIREYFKMKQFFQKYAYGKDKKTKTNKKHTSLWQRIN